MRRICNQDPFPALPKCRYGICVHHEKEAEEGEGQILTVWVSVIAVLETGEPKGMLGVASLCQVALNFLRSTGLRRPLSA